MLKTIGLDDGSGLESRIHKVGSKERSFYSRADTPENQTDNEKWKENVGKSKSFSLSLEFILETEQAKGSPRMAHMTERQIRTTSEGVDPMACKWFDKTRQELADGAG